MSPLMPFDASRLKLRRMRLPLASECESHDEVTSKWTDSA
jgi:hypothetical protein